MENRDLFDKNRIDEFLDKFYKFVESDKDLDGREAKYTKDSVRSLDRDSVYNFYFDILDVMCGVEKVKQDPKLIKKYFSKSDILKIAIDSDRYVGSKIETVATVVAPEYCFYDSIRLSSWHFDGSDSLGYEECDNIYKIIHEMQTPDNDERFRVRPVYTKAFGFNSRFVGGLTDRDCLKGEKVGFKKDLDGNIVRKDNDESRVFIDGKIGLMFYFKDMPSILVSFNFDDKKNLYIQQIQAQHKSRGHYKLGDNWRSKIVDLIKQSFPEYSVNLVSGEEIVKRLLEQYKNAGDDAIPPKDSVLSRVEKEYDKIYKDFEGVKESKKSGFRKIP